MIWCKDLECMSRNDIEKMQLERLKHTVKHVYDNVPYYHSVLESAGIKPENINTLDDIRRIPFTTKDNLRNHYPYGLFAVPLKRIVRLHASSGTTGKPTVVGYTKKDLETWTELVARVIVQAGVRADDIAQVAFGYGLFTGAFGLHYGLEKVGATVIPASSGNTEKQIMLMQDFQTSVLISTPSYAMYMVEVLEQMGIDPGDIKLRLGLFGAEGSTEEMRAELEKRWNITATENYGLSEIIGPGVSGECIYKCGLHIAEDHFIAEIIDPITGEIKKPGEKGELVITTITKEGLPLLRYRTRDITLIDKEPCKCGRTMARMAKVQGRSDDMLIIRGVNVFPSQIEGVLVGMDDVGPHYEIIVKKRGYMDELEINVEVIDGQMLEKFSQLEALEQKIKHQLRTILSIDAKVNLVEPKSLKRFEGKAKRVIDLRN